MIFSLGMLSQVLLAARDVVSVITVRWDLLIFPYHFIFTRE